MLSEVAVGLKNRGRFRNADHALMFDSYGVTGNVDVHSSVYLYTDDVLNYVRKHKSMSDYSGRVFSDALHWDFDDNDNITKAYNDTCELISRLKDSGFDDHCVVVYFSGNKGYHVVASSDEIKNIDSDDLPDKVKFICKKFASGLNTFDDSVYNRTRILRVTNTINPKSGLYKIGFSIDEFLKLSPEEISNMAKDVKVSPKRVTDASPNKITQQVLDEYTPEERRASEKTYQNLPSGIQVGNRNNSLTSLAGLLRSRNVPMDVVSRAVHNENAMLEKPLPVNDVNSIIKSISRYSPKSEYREINKSNLLTMEEAGKKWFDLRKRVSEVDTGYVHLNKILQYYDPSETCFLAGRAGTMKTSSAMQVARNIANSINGDVLMSSLEMGSSKVFFRSATITNNRNLDTPDKNIDVTTKLLSDKNNTLYRQTCDYWKNFVITDMDSMSLDQIEAAWNEAQKLRNNNMQLLLIDYFGLIKNDGSYQDMSIVARGLKSLAKRLNTRVMCLAQLSRLAGNGTEEPEMHMMRDTGALEEAADYAIGLWRDPKDKFRIHAKDMKNRNDDNDSTVKWDFINHGIYLKEEPFKDSSGKNGGTSVWERGN